MPAALPSGDWQGCEGGPAPFGLSRLRSAGETGTYRRERTYAAPTELASNQVDGDLIDERTCAFCDRVYTREERRAHPGWEPADHGWRCPSCARERHAGLRDRARLLIERTQPSWTLVAYPPPDVDADVLATARDMLLTRGGLTCRESLALRRELLGG